MLPQVNEKEYEKLQETEPKAVNIDTRRGWLIMKQHYGPLSASERLELARKTPPKDETPKRA